MYLLDGNEGILQNNNTAFYGGSTSNPALILRRFWAALQGEERPSHMLWLLAILVLLLHIWVLTLLKKPEENITEAKPLPMEVSMVTIAAPKPIVTAPKPAPPPPEPPKVIKPKPIVKKPAPVVQKAPSPEKQEAPDFAPFEPFKPAPPQQTSQSTNTSSTSTTPSTSSTEASNAPAVHEGNVKINCIKDPKPDYPAIAKSRGWQGKGLLLIKVSAQGLIETVSLEQSTGHEILDDSAIEAAKKWKCTPNKHGDTPVTSLAKVPFSFTLK